MKRKTINALLSLMLGASYCYGLFEHTFPLSLETEKFHWQISKDPNFLTVDLEEKQDDPLLLLSDEQLPASGCYYLRTKSLSNHQWSDWSETDPLHLLKQDEDFAALEPIKQMFLDDATLNLINPHLIPSNSPAKIFLDKIFGKKHLTYSKDSLEKAGFKCSKNPKWNNIIIAKHPGLSGYVLKLFTDDQPEVNELENFLRRIEGSKIVNEAIEKLGYQKFFKTPRKWIYSLPETDDVAENPKKFILVAQDMRILSTTKNNKRWRSAHAVTPKKLEMLYNILEETGLHDSVYIDNIPFSTDGKIAFIDTEHYQHWPIHYSILTQFLDRKMQQYWQELVYQSDSHLK